MLRISCVSSRLFLHNYIDMRSQQNIQDELNFTAEHTPDNDEILCVLCK